MADNTTLSAGAGGDTIATDDIAGVKYQRVKVTFGADGAAADVAAAEPLPIKISDGTDVALVTAGGALTVDNSAVTQPVSNAGLTALNGAILGSEVQADIVAALPAGNNNIGDVDVATLPATVHSADYDTGAGTDTTLAFGIAVPANGGAAVIPGDATAGLKVDLGADNDVVVTNAGTFAVQAAQSGTWTVQPGNTANTTAWKVDGSAVTQPVSGPLTDAELRATAVPVSLASVPSHAVTNAGTFAVQESGGALTALQIMDDWDEADRAKVNAQQVSGQMIENAIAVTVKRAIIDAATSGDNTLVAAVTGKKVRVLSLFLVSAGTVTVRFESGAGGTALTGQMNLVANTGFVLPHNDHGWFETADATLLNMELSAAVSVDGALTYIEAE